MSTLPPSKMYVDREVARVICAACAIPIPKDSTLVKLGTEIACDTCGKAYRACDGETDPRILIEDHRPVYFKVSIDEGEVYFWGYARPAPRFTVEEMLAHRGNAQELIKFLGLTKRQGFEDPDEGLNVCISCVEDPDSYPDSVEGFIVVEAGRVFECASCEKAFIAT